MRTLKLLLAITALTFATPALAQKGGSRIGQGKNLGLGLAIGSPSFLTAKYFLDSKLALDFGLDFARWGSGIGLHGDVLFHTNSLITDANIALPLYFGAGVNVATWSWGWNDRWGRRYYNGGADLGIRGVGGAALWLKKVPLEFFVEIGPELWVLHGPRLQFFGSVGVRYYF